MSTTMLKRQKVINIHRNCTRHDFDREKPNILDFESNWNKRVISEMLHIKSNVNAINKKEDVQKLNKCKS